MALSEGPDVTFYDFLGIPPSASQEDIKKAYHKKSRLLHPDKIKQNLVASAKTHDQNKPSRSEIKNAQKDASDRYARLTIVVNILRGAGRERYDFFLSNGFPKWKGTGYYYARFRPGLGSVLLGLFICVGGGGHWLALYLGWKRQKEFVGRYVKFARHAAWGEVGVPGVENLGGVGNASQVVGGTVGEELEPGQVVNRRQRRLQEKEGRKDKDKSRKRPKGASGTSTPVGERAIGAKKRVVAENGKILVVDSSGNVFLEQADEEGEMHEFLLDVSPDLSHYNYYDKQLTNTSPTSCHDPPFATLHSIVCPSGPTPASSLATCLVDHSPRRRSTSRVTIQSKTKPQARIRPRLILRCWRVSRQPLPMGLASRPRRRSKAANGSAG